MWVPVYPGKCLSLSMWVPACACVWDTCTHVSVRGWPWLLFLGCLPLLFEMSLNFNQIDLASWPASPRDPALSASPFPVPGVTSVHHHSWFWFACLLVCFLPGLWESKLRPSCLWGKYLSHGAVSLARAPFSLQGHNYSSVFMCSAPTPLEPDCKISRGGKLVTSLVAAFGWKIHDNQLLQEDDGKMSH